MAGILIGIQSEEPHGRSSELSDQHRAVGACHVGHIRAIVMALNS
jgi:hypothetical protein